MAITTVVITAVGYSLYRLLARREQIPAIAAEEVSLTPLTEGVL